VFKLVLICITAILLAGCAGNSVHNLPASEHVSTNVLHVLPPPQAVKPIVPVSAPRAVPAPITTWTSLNGWASEHNVGSPHRIPDSPVAAYSIASKNGTMIVEIGEREATWNGIEITLGFAPQIIDGEVYLHGLDLEKNLEPLLCEPPMEFPTNHVIVIDPGHGGRNVGTHSVLDGRFEKEFTLDLAKRLKPLLEAEGWKVFLTRDSDEYVTNADRVVFAEARRADLYISLHFNSGAPDETQNGLETYCVTPTGEPSTVTRNYADPWNENLPNNAFDSENLQLAVRIHSALLQATGMEDRGVRRARFIEVLRGQRRPAILIEAGYLSNPQEATRIENGDYRQKLAETLAAALKPSEN
jgi:N-acetylmuramoyl-L-alanine amidase